MQRARRLVGMTVKSLGGDRLGEVRDVLLDSTARQVVGLAVVTGSVLRRPRYVHRGDIVEIDGEGVIIASAESLVSRLPSGRGLAEPGSPLGSRVAERGGESVGHVRDVLLNPKNLSVWGFEVSEGLVSDVLHGTTRLPRRRLRRVGRCMVLARGRGQGPHMNRREYGNSTS